MQIFLIQILLGKVDCIYVYHKRRFKYIFRGLRTFSVTHHIHSNANNLLKDFAAYAIAIMKQFVRSIITKL